MGTSFSLSEDKKTKTNKIINFQVLEGAKEEKYDSPDIINKDLIKNDNHSNNKDIIKAKQMNKFENIISEKILKNQ